MDSLEDAGWTRMAPHRVRRGPIDISLGTYPDGEACVEGTVLSSRIRTPLGDDPPRTVVLMTCLCDAILALTELDFHQLQYENDGYRAIGDLVMRKTIRGDTLEVFFEAEIDFTEDGDILDGPPIPERITVNILHRASSSRTRRFFMDDGYVECLTVNCRAATIDLVERWIEKLM